VKRIYGNKFKIQTIGNLYQFFFNLQDIFVCGPQHLAVLQVLKNFNFRSPVTVSRADVKPLNETSIASLANDVL
jgi:hypothetical protein